MKGWFLRRRLLGGRVLTVVQGLVLDRRMLPIMLRYLGAHEQVAPSPVQLAGISTPSPGSSGASNQCQIRLLPLHAGDRDRPVAPVHGAEVGG